MEQIKIPSMRYIDNMPKEDVEKYAGHWIVVVDDKVVYKAKSVKDLYGPVDGYDENGDMPVIKYIPDDVMQMLV